jgi:hypothetical protein
MNRLSKAFGKKAPYPATTASEMTSRDIFQSLLDARFVKAFIQVLDKVPNFDGHVDITDDENRSIGLLLVQGKTLDPKDYKKPKFQCEGSFLSACNDSVLPVLLVAVDQEHKIAYWIHISKELLEDAAERIKGNSVSIPFPKDNVLNRKDQRYIGAWTDIVQAVKEKVQNYDALLQDNRTLAAENTALSTKVQEQEQQLLVSEETIRSYFTSELEVLNKLKKQGRHLAVLEIIENEAHPLWKDATPEDDYKRNVLRALTYLDLNDFEKAAPILVSLADHPHQHADTLNLVAIGYLISGNRRKAESYARKGIAAYPNDPNGYAVLIRLQGDQMTDKDGTSVVVPENVAANITVQLAFARRHEDQNQAKAACVIYEKLALNPPSDELLAFDIQSYYAIALVQSLEYPELMLKDKSQTASCTKIQKAKELFSSSIDCFKKTDLLSSRYYLYINRGVAFKLLGETDASNDDFRQAYAVRKSYITFRYLLINGPASDWERLLPEADALVLNPDETLELAQLRAEHLLAASKPEEALKAMQPFTRRKRIITGKDNFGYILLADIYSALSQKEKLYSLVNHLQKKQGSSFVYYYLAVRLETPAGSHPDVLALKRKLVDETAKVNHVWARTMTFDLLIRGQEFRLAADIYRPICPNNSFTDLTRKLLEALFLGGLYKEAEERLRVFTGTVHDNDFVTDMLSSIYDRTKSRAAAISVIQSYLVDHESELLRIKLALLFTETNDVAAARLQLEKVQTTIPVNSTIAFLLAQAYLKAGMSRKGLELAYSLLREGERLFHVHQNYQVFINSSAQADRRYSAEGRINLDSYVQLEKGTTIRELILVDNPKFDKEIGLSAIESSELIGQEVGQTVILDNQSWLVRRVISKYKWLFLSSTATLSGNATPMKEPTIDYFRQDMNIYHAQVATAIEQAVRALQIMELLASEHNLNIVHFWRTVVVEYAIPVFAVASDIEYRTLTRPIEKKEPLLYDISTLVTIQETNAWFLVDLLDNPKYITFSTVRVLEEYLSILQLSVINGERSVFGMKNGLPYEKVLTVEMQKREEEYVRAFKNSVLDRFTVIEGDVPEDYNDYLLQVQHLGRCNADALRILERENVTLVTDDAFFRSYLASRSITTRSVTQLAFALSAAGTINSTAKADLLYQLLNRSFWNFPINLQFLVSLYEREQFTIGPVIRRAIDPALSGPTNNLISIFLPLFHSILKLDHLPPRKKQESLADLFQLYFSRHPSITDKTLFSNRIDLEAALSEEQKTLLNQELKNAYQAIHAGN